MNPLRASSLQVAGRTFQWGTRTYVMGILNLTPDSFSGDGLLAGGDVVHAAVQLARRFQAQGADLLDVGAESSRPDAAPITAQQELERLLPVLSALVEAVELPISVDTYRARVAEAALELGADLINDIWSLRADPQMAPLVSERQVPVILMHNRLQPESEDLRRRLASFAMGTDYGDVLEEVMTELMSHVDVALAAGLAPDRILLDPGIGFGKTVDQNLVLLNELGAVRELGYPLLLGPSRKSFIGHILGLPPDQRLEGTAAAVAIGIARGADIVRVHDVREMALVAKMTDAIVRV